MAGQDLVIIAGDRTGLPPWGGFVVTLGRGGSELESCVCTDLVVDPYRGQCVCSTNLHGIRIWDPRAGRLKDSGHWDTIGFERVCLWACVAPGTFIVPHEDCIAAVRLNPGGRDAYEVLLPDAENCDMDILDLCAFAVAGVVDVLYHTFDPDVEQSHTLQGFRWDQASGAVTPFGPTAAGTVYGLFALRNKFYAVVRSEDQGGIWAVDHDPAVCFAARVCTWAPDRESYCVCAGVSADESRVLIAAAADTPDTPNGRALRGYAVYDTASWAPVPGFPQRVAQVRLGGTAVYAHESDALCVAAYDAATAAPLWRVPYDIPGCTLEKVLSTISFAVVPEPPGEYTKVAMRADATK